MTTTRLSRILPRPHVTAQEFDGGMGVRVFLPGVKPEALDPEQMTVSLSHDGASAVLEVRISKRGAHFERELSETYLG